MKVGELIGLTVRRATVEALRWQNGLEASYTRGLFHALGRYGLKEANVFDDLARSARAGRSRAAQEEQQGGVLRTARRRRRSRARGGARSRAPRHASGIVGARRHGPAGGDARREPRRQARRVAGISRRSSTARPARIPNRWCSPPSRSAGRRSGGRADRRCSCPHPAILLVAVAADLAIGDPAYPLHPVRLIGKTARRHRDRCCGALGADGYGGGIVLFVALAAVSLAGGDRDRRRRRQGRQCALAGWHTPSSSTAFSRSAICCATSGASSRRWSRGDLDAARDSASRRSSAATSTAWTPPPAGARPSRASART